jgi:uncharacterized damage-inducible protein DinB
MNEREVIESALDHSLSGKGAHVEMVKAFGGLDWKLAGARPPGVEHSIFQLLHHINYWQEWVVKWLDGGDPPIPEHASGSWPGDAAPESGDDWEKTMRRFQRGLEDLRRRSRESELFQKRISAGAEKSRLEMLHTIASHGSYHVGQVVLLRQMLGAWPPPSGGLTW